MRQIDNFLILVLLILISFFVMAMPLASNAASAGNETVVIAVVSKGVELAAQSEESQLRVAQVAEKTVSQTPKVPFQYSLGRQKYQAVCSGCHGKWGEGSEQGPPLMHAFYKPSHHGDASFYRAALQGVKAHHWQFGDMPKIEGVTRKDMDKIVPFIRWLQREKGVY